MKRGADAFKTGGACKAIGQAHAEQQDARRQRAQHEIFEACLCRTVVAPRTGRQHISRQRVQLQTDVQRQQVGGRNHQPHAHHREYDQQRIFGAHLPLAFEKSRRHQQRGGGCNIDQQLGIGGETVGAVLAEESAGLMPHHAVAQGRNGEPCGGSQGGHPQPGQRAGGLVPAPCRDQQHDQPGQAEDVLGGDHPQ